MLGRQLLLLTVAMLGVAMLSCMHGIDMAGVKQSVVELYRTRGYGITAKEASSLSGKHSLWVLRNFWALLAYCARSCVGILLLEMLGSSFFKT